ncbi:hypothetical protein HNR23_002252 [Nocardiopsis mwathae]|uniref:Uncharacterized protein n=1 Tax=Nocardiopsis mwathae TaxID=1472723 RepID=A0A7W9YHF6_9ACTN|nr:hypothetical protein [Nocardiopsis mwathae]MBB6172192.1 hypothetical protein [Nocardiopsis mwathae]
MTQYIYAMFFMSGWFSWWDTAAYGPNIAGGLAGGLVGGLIALAIALLVSKREVKQYENQRIATRIDALRRSIVDEFAIACDRLLNSSPAECESAFYRANHAATEVLLALREIRPETQNFQWFDQEWKSVHEIYERQLILARVVAKDARTPVVVEPLKSDELDRATGSLTRLTNACHRWALQPVERWSPPRDPKADEIERS